MNKKWEVRKVSTSEDIFRQIAEDMPQPVGIVLFGADYELKNEVISEVISSLPGLATSISAAPTPTLVEYIQTHDIVTVILTPEESAMHELRHELVKVMRNAGAETMVGIYVKANLKFMKNEHKHHPTEVLPARKRNNDITAIERSNPTADGLDYFIVVEEEE